MNRNMEAITWAMHARGIGPVAWRMLVTLAGRVNSERDDFDVWPAWDRIAEDCEISASSARRHMKMLVDLGYVEVIAQFRDNGANGSNRYRLQVRKTIVMPDRKVEIVPGGGCQSDRGEGVNLTGGGCQSYDRGEGVTADRGKEPLKEGTSESEYNPPLPSEEAPPGEIDLFGMEGVRIPVMPPGEKIIMGEISLIDHVTEGWSRLVEQYPRIQKIRVLNASRERKLRARAAEVAKASGGELSPFDVWDQIFSAIRASPFLRGEADPGRNFQRPFSLSIDYILRPAEFIRTLERALTDEHDNQLTSDARTGRQFGPGEQATRAALQRLQSAGRQG